LPQGDIILAQLAFPRMTSFLYTTRIINL
jgi:hypothetical protein